jgi:hypothetical protein
MRRVDPQILILMAATALSVAGAALVLRGATRDETATVGAARPPRPPATVETTHLLRAPIVLVATFLGDGTTRRNTADGGASGERAGDGPDAARYTVLRLGVQQVIENDLDLSPSSMEYVASSDDSAPRLIPGRQYVLFFHPGRNADGETDPYLQVLRDALELDGQQRVRYPGGETEELGDLMRDLIDARLPRWPTEQAAALAATADAVATIKERTPRPPDPTFMVEGVADDPDVLGLLAGLRRRGLAVRPEGRSMVGWLGGAQGQAYRAGDSGLYVHRYSSAAAAASAAAEIPPTADNGMTDWVDEPHFFRCGALIVLYAGREGTATRTLEEACGPPFAEADWE